MGLFGIHTARLTLRGSISGQNTQKVTKKNRGGCSHFLKQRRIGEWIQTRACQRSQAVTGDRAGKGAVQRGVLSGWEEGHPGRALHSAMPLPGQINASGDWNLRRKQDAYSWPTEETNKMQTIPCMVAMTPWQGGKNHGQILHQPEHKHAWLPFNTNRHL